MFEIFFLALALSMDAFAVSLGLGAKYSGNKRYFSILVGMYFGLLQGLMPLLGYLGGIQVFGFIKAYAYFLAFALLAMIGIKMIYGALTETSNDNADKELSKNIHVMLFALALVTSVDAMAAGFSLAVRGGNPFVSSIIIGLVTLVLSGVGVFLGAKSGGYLGRSAECLGGIILIFIGLKLVLL